MVRYCRPQDISEAVSALAAAGNSARVLVGGTDLLVRVRHRPLEPLLLVDLKTARDLPPAVEATDTSVTIGPTATMSEIAASETLQQWFPALVAASKVVGSIAIRNRATLIGNICNASPAADTAPALLVHGATVQIVGSEGQRSVPLAQFFLGPGTMACQPDEIVISVTIERPPAGYCSTFERLTRRRGVDLATVSVAAGVSPAGDISLGLGAVGPTPLHTSTASPIDLADAAEVEIAVQQLIQVATPISDIRAGEDYRKAMTLVLARRAVRGALDTIANSGDAS